MSKPDQSPLQTKSPSESAPDLTKSPVIQPLTDDTGAKYHVIWGADGAAFRCMQLRPSSWCQILFGPEDNIQEVRWKALEGGIGDDFIEILQNPENFPVMILLDEGKPVFVESPMSVMAGNAGIAIKKDKEIKWISSAQFMGVVNWNRDHPQYKGQQK
jgi:hypothetical protein